MLATKGRLLRVAILGLVTGLAARAAHGLACDYDPPMQWRLTLLEVTSSDPSAGHRRFWPKEARLRVEPDWVGFRSPPWLRTPGHVSSVTATR